MSFHPPVQLFESAKSERPLSRTEYCLLHNVGEVCAIASYDLLCRTLYWNQVRLGLSVDLERYYGQALQQAEWAGFHKISFHGNHVGGHTGYHFVQNVWTGFKLRCAPSLAENACQWYGTVVNGITSIPLFEDGGDTCLGPIMRDLTWV